MSSSAVQLEDAEREKKLLEWTTARCMDPGGTIAFAEGWKIIKENGLDVLSAMLRKFLLSKNNGQAQDRAPFGKKGITSLYTTSYKVVNCNSTNATKDDPARLFYDQISNFIKEHLNSADIRAVIDNRTSSISLREFISIWQSYKIMTKWICYLFGHLEGGVIKLNELLTLTSVALKAFYDVVYIKFAAEQTALTLSCILKEREGELIDIELMQESLQIYSMMGVATKITGTMAPDLRAKLSSIDAALKLQEFRQVYDADFEKDFLKETKDFYVRKSREWIASSDVGTYVSLIDDVLAKEEKRLLAYLNPSTKPKLIRVCLEECVYAHKSALFESLKEMLRGIYDNTQVSASEVIFCQFSLNISLSLPSLDVRELRCA